ncbi:MAG: type II toxin-antitoxin system RelE/ParE family toxin [Candidatus Binatia bacterium]
MTRDIIVSGAADEDINGCIACTNGRNSEAARRFLAALRHAFERLRSMPETGHTWETERRELQGLRVWPIDDFPLSVFYFPHPDAIEVIRVLHHSRDIKAILG